MIHPSLTLFYCIATSQFTLIPFLLATIAFPKIKVEKNRCGIPNTFIYFTLFRIFINPFYANVPFLYPLKMSENQGYRTFTSSKSKMETLEKGVKYIRS